MSQRDIRDIDGTLRGKHNTAFRHSLSLSLAEQEAEIEEYLSESADAVPTLRSWVNERSYERLVPRRAHECERLLFLSDMENLLQLLVEKPVISGACLNLTRQSRASI